MLKGITINTPADEPAHIVAEDDAAIFEGMIGVDGVFEIGRQFAYEIMSVNVIRIYDGVLFVGGRMGRIPAGSFEELHIENGAAGMYRNDLIVAQFTNTSGTDVMSLKVIRGNSNSEEAEDPEYIQEDLYNGGAVREYPLYRVVLHGLLLERMEPLFETYWPYTSLPKVYIQNYEPEADEGSIWINPEVSEVEQITLTPLNGFTNYNGGAGDAVVISKVGNIVEMQGRYNPSASHDIGSATEVTMCTVPAGYRPTRRVVEVMQGSNGYTYQLGVNTSGVVTACRHRNGADYMSPTTTMQLWIRAVWITAE